MSLSKYCLLLLSLFVFATASQARTTAEGLGIRGEIAVADLPKEAQETLAKIERGGPFPYDRDGIVFQNREKALPKQKKGYYREFTVKTPGAKNRGARRIVAGDPKEYYYSDDHYQSFKKIIIK